MRLLFLLPILLFSACMPRKSAETSPPPAKDTMLIYKFSNEQATKDWRVEDDTVMGGRSDGKFTITEEGYGRFYGSVSLENNGGFSSVQQPLTERIDLGAFQSFQLRLKGDGKNYTFRVKAKPGDRHSYAFTFPTNGDWETITIPFAAMEPVYRGYDVNVPNYAGEPASMLRILIGNKKPQNFELLIDKIVAL